MVICNLQGCHLSCERPRVCLALIEQVQQIDSISDGLALEELSMGER